MIPLLPFFLAYLGGILAAVAASGKFWFPLIISLALASSGIFARGFRQRFPPGKLAGIVALFLFGTMAPALPDYFKPPNHVLTHLMEGKPALVEGNLIQTPVRLEDRIHYIIELTRVRYKEVPRDVTGRARITYYFPSEEDGRANNSGLVPLAAGDRVQFQKVRLKQPRNFKNPGRFNYQRFMRSRGIDVTGNVSRPERVVRLGSFPLPFFDSIQINLKDRFMESLKALFPGTEGPLLQAMLLGEKQSLPGEIREAYHATGLSHLMAVSGLHIGFVAAAGYCLFWPMAIYGLYRIRPQWALAGHARTLSALLCMGPVLFYMILAGPKISALRAGIMVLLFLSAILLNRTHNMFNALLAAALLILIWDPHAVLDVSFQMSFTAMLCILFVLHHVTGPSKDPVDRLGEQSWIREQMRGGPPPENENSTAYVWRRIQRMLFGTALVSLAAILGTLPIIIFHFHRISLAGFFLNLLMVPLAAMLIPAALFVVSLGMFWPALAGWLTLPVIGILKLFLFIPVFFASLPYSSTTVPTPPGFWFVLYYGVLFGGIYWWGQDSPLARFKQPAVVTAGFCLAGLGVVLWLVWPRFPELSTDKLKVTFLDVGQGESIFIEFPNRETLLIDGGGFYKNLFDVGRYVVAPFLWYQGIRRIDYLAVTHSDNDHIRGLESLVKLFPVGNFLDRLPGNRDPRIDRLRTDIMRNNTALVRLESGQPLTIGEARLIPLHPGPRFLQETGAENDRLGNDLSLVLRLEYRNFRLLLTGDIGQKTEEYLVRNGVPLEAEFLKAPHHGSRFSNSSSFIGAVRPRAVFFSSGHLNRMRHPHPESLRRYRESGAEIWRTDLNGAISISTDGYRHHIASHEYL